MGRPICQVISAAMSPALATKASTGWLNSAPGAASVRDAQARWARWAVSSARSMPAAVSRGRSTYTRPSTGLMVFSVSVMPYASVSDDFEISRQFPIGDCLAELPFFPLPDGGIVLDEGVAKQGAPALGAGPAVRGLIKCRGQAPVRRMLEVVGVALECPFPVHAMPDAPRPV